MTFRLLGILMILASSAQAAENSPEPEPTSPETNEPAASETAIAKAPAVEVLLDLAMAQEMAVRENPSIHAAQARVKQAAERVKQARAAWFPTLFATASASNTWISENDYDFAKRVASNGYWTSFALGTQARLQGEALAFAQIAGNNFASLFNPAVQAVPWAVPNRIAPS